MGSSSGILGYVSAQAVDCKLVASAVELGDDFEFCVVQAATPEWQGPGHPYNYR